MQNSNQNKLDREIDSLIATFAPWWPAADTPLVRRHVRAAFEKARSLALDDAALECDRFLEKLKGRWTPNQDGAFVAITRLVRNIRSMKTKGKRRP